MPKHPLLKIHSGLSEHSLFKFQTFREHDIILDMYMLEQRIYKLLQFRHHESVGITSVLRYLKTVGNLFDMQISVTFSFVLHVHYPYRVCYRPAVHRLNAYVPFRSVEKFKQIREQYVFLFLQMVLQVFKRNADQIVQLVQFRMSFSVSISHLFYQFQKYRTVVSDASVMNL